jgi:hypothetical protein
MPTLEETATATLEEAATAVLRTLAAGKSASEASSGTKIGGMKIAGKSARVAWRFLAWRFLGNGMTHSPEIAELPTEMGEYIHYHTSAVCFATRAHNGAFQESDCGHVDVRPRC